VIVHTTTVLGEVIAEGVRFTVSRTPAGNWRISLRGNAENGLNFIWRENLFAVFHGAPKSLEQTDAECVRILKNAAEWQRAIMGA
jgi:hypothetical protein